MTDGQLYARGTATMLAAWRAYARWSRGASVQRLPGVELAVFPSEPERGIYNNAVLQTVSGIEPMEAAYAAAGVERFAAWVREDDDATAAELQRRGYRFDMATRAMGMPLDDLDLPRPELELD